MLRVITVTLCASVVLIGALHHPALRGLLGECPIPASASSAAEADANRTAALAPLAGTREVVPTTSLGLTLGDLDAEALDAWVSARGGACAPAADTFGLRCDAWSLDGAPATLTADVDAAGRVVSLSLSLRLTDADRASDAYDAALAALVGPWGSPEHTAGAPGSAWLASGLAHQRRARWAGRGAIASLAATHLGDGYVVHQTVQLTGGPA